MKAARGERCPGRLRGRTTSFEGSFRLTVTKRTLSPNWRSLRTAATARWISSGSQRVERVPRDGDRHAARHGYAMSRRFRSGSTSPSGGA